MRTRRWAILVGLGGALLAVVLIGVGPETADSYRSTVESSVQDAVSSVGTAELIGRNALQGNAFSSYESTVLDDARTNVATAVTDVIELPLTGTDTRQLRDEVLPLLQESARLIGDLDIGVEDDDQASVTASVDSLTEVGERLATVLEGLR